MRHSECQHALYDYLLNELAVTDRAAIEEHLASCTQCQAECEDIRQTLALLPHPLHSPADEREAPYWHSLALSIQQKIQKTDQRKINLLSDMFQTVRSFLTFRPATGFALGGSLAAITLALILLRPQPIAEQNAPGNATLQADPDILQVRTDNEKRIGEYFSKSKTLLVGIANMKTGDDLDLSAERKLSRNLVHEARYLTQQQLDGRSAKLVSDLQKILVELANLEETNDVPNVELIRSGIRQENLLFKIRMAEASLDGDQRQFY